MFSEIFGRKDGDKLVYENISRLCKRKGITIKQLEEKTGLKNGAIGKWQIHSPTVKNLQKVADYFGVTVNYLLREWKKEDD
jgi:transcriptional regulator with XRE-family HTH domain